jgi:hypothetical protein
VTAGVTATAGFVGTFNYAAPEQIKNETITPAVDIYALTGVVFQCFTRSLPFARETDAAVLHAHLCDPPPAVTLGTPGAAAFNRLVARGMAKDPVERFPSAGELMDEATEVLDMLSPASRRLSSAFRPSSPAEQSEHSGDHTAEPDVETLDVAPRPPAPVAAASVKRRRVALITGAMAVTLAVAGGIVALTAGDAPARHSGSTVRGAPFVMRYARPWRATNADVAGAFALAQTHSAASTGDNGRTLRLGSSGATLVGGLLARSSLIPGGVPPALVERYGPPIDSGDVEVAGHSGRRYVWAPGGESLVAYVLPFSTGDGAIICQTGVTNSTAVRSCGRLVEGAAVRGGQPIPPGPDMTLAKAIRDDLAAVRTARSAERSATSTFTAAARVAHALARTELTAANRLEQLSAPPRYERTMTDLVVALRNEAHRVQGLEAAAASDSSNSAAYSKAAKHVTAASSEVASSSAAFARYHLDVPRLAVLHLSAPPEPVVTPPSPGPNTNSTVTPPAPLPNYTSPHTVTVIGKKHT